MDILLKQEKNTEKKIKEESKEKSQLPNEVINGLKIIYGTLGLPEIKGQLSYKNTAIVYSAMRTVEDYFGLTITN